MNPWPIKPLTPQDLDFGVVAYGFRTLTGSDLADVPSTETAIDTSLLDFGSSIADQTPLIASLFDGLDDLGFITGEIDNSPLDGTLGELANAASAGDAALSDYTGQIGGSAPPPTSGGGGGGGTPSTPCGDLGNATASENIGTVILGTGPQSVDINYANRTSQPVQVTAATMTQDAGGPWTWTPAVPVTVPAGQQVKFGTLTLATTQTGTFTCLLTVTSDQPGSPFTFCIQASVTAAPPAGGGGGGPIFNAPQRAISLS